MKKHLFSKKKSICCRLLNWLARMKRLGREWISSLAKKIRHLLENFINYICVLVKVLASVLRFENLLELIGGLDLQYPISITVFIVLVGILVNHFAKEKFPYFIIFQAMLLFTICTAYYSIRKIKKFNCEGSNFRIDSAGEKEILAARARYERIAKSNINYILPIVFGGSISLIASSIFSVQIDLILRIYCFSALAVILAVCAIGFSQYFFFIYFLIHLAKKADKIKQFDTALPAKTNWLIDLANMANWYSTMYFLVGLIYVALFYEFSFSPTFGMLNLLPNAQYPLYFLWTIIIVVIIFGFPITTILGLFALRTITVQLKSHQETNLRLQREHTSDVPLQTAIDSLLILLDNTPTIPQKPLIGYIGSFIIGTINLCASIQAVLQLIPGSV